MIDKYTDPVGNKSRSIFTKNGGLTQEKISIVHDEVDHFRICEPSWNDLKKFKISWGVEKMCSTKMFFEIVASSFSH